LPQKDNSLLDPGSKMDHRRREKQQPHDNPHLHRLQESAILIHRGKIMRILKAYVIPPNLLRAIERIYTNTKARVIMTDGVTQMFYITVGVLQGDTLAPFLFIIVLDHAMRQATLGRVE
jgi:hypothetical protein